jgi:hypothetical protein
MDARPRRRTRHRALRHGASRQARGRSALPVKGIQVDGGPEFKAAFEEASTCSSSHPSGPSSTAMSSAPRDHGDTSSTPPTTCPGASIASRPSSTLRRIALSLAKANTSEGSVRGKTKRVGCDDAFLAASFCKCDSAAELGQIVASFSLGVYAALPPPIATTCAAHPSRA